MKFIEKIRKNTQKGIDRNMRLEYKRAIKDIESSAERGRYATKFHIYNFYENKNDIYFYIMDRLKSKGFEVEVEKYGCNMSWTRLIISWNRK